jgi:hypothetical protein
MEIIMDQSEIEEAIRAHLGSYFTLNANEKMVVELATAHDSDGFEARIEITSEQKGAAPNTTG